MQAVRNIHRQAIGAPAPQRLPDERRGTVRAVSAWASLQKNDAIPVLAELLGRHRFIAAQEFLLKTDPMPQRSVFILCGDALRALLDRPVLGTTFWDCMPRAARDALSQACAAAMKQGAPAHQAGAFEIEAGVEVRYRGVFLPLRSPSLHSPSLRSPGHDDPGYLFGAYGSRVFAATTPAAA